jgi:hypothetical protein
MLSWLMSGLVKPGVFATSGYISGGPSLVDDGGAASSVTFFAQTHLLCLPKFARDRTHFAWRHPGG